ncbi:MAG TPA: PEP-CTERM sorting domain-containing protein [Acidobacteriaceae bacterium]
MSRRVFCLLAILFLGVATTPSAFADENIGYISYDLTTPPGTAQFDIVNLTGANELGSPFNVLTAVNLSNLSLDVKFASGPDEIFGSSYFTLNADGLSFDGTAKSTGAANPIGFNGAISAILTGDFSATTLLLDPSGTDTVNASFITTLTGSGVGGALEDGDFAVIVATTGTSGPPPPSTPEPETLMMVGTGLAGLAGLRRRRYVAVVRGFLSRKVAVCATVVVVAAAVAAMPVAAHATNVTLSSWTSPSSGASGSTVVALTGNGFPSLPIDASAVTVSLSTTCGGSPTNAAATSVSQVLGSTDRVKFLVPGSLATGTYFVSVAGMNASAVSFASTNCSQINVTHTSTALAACLPSSSLAVLTGTNVNAYVPKGWWGGGTNGVSLVPIEGSDTPSAISTAHPINSCSSNSQTGETVCVDNLTDVYEIVGNTITASLTSGSNSSAGFSGGTCKNCGVAINALTNTAVINMGLIGGASGDGIQLLDLATNTFAPAFPTAAAVSENISVDPNRNLILSPNEDGVYDLLTISPTGALTEYEHAFATGGGEPDSAAEDCTTGIALATNEFTGDLYISDLTQAVFTPPSGGQTFGTWTAPSQLVNFPEFDGFAAGTSGISVAAGTTHLGITTGEFGGRLFGVFQLPATSGTGTPSFVDYVAANMPNTPDGGTFSAGFDPHTITAYTSPNNGKAYGLIADWENGVVPKYVGVVDLAALLAAPRTGTHTVDPSYNLVTNGVVRYVVVP